MPLDLATVSSFKLWLPTHNTRNTCMKQTFTVTGMTCGHCEKSVKQAILTLDPQAQVTIDRSQNHVEVDSSQAREKIAEAIAEEGYTVAA